MRFKDEKVLWWAETEALAARLADKNQQELLEIFEENDVVRIHSCDRPKISIFNRVMSIFTFPVFIILMGVKWLLTGDQYLESWCKRSKALEFLFKISGHGK